MSTSASPPDDVALYQELHAVALTWVDNDPRRARGLVEAWFRGRYDRERIDAARLIQQREGTSWAG